MPPDERVLAPSVTWAKCDLRALDDHEALARNVRNRSNFARPSTDALDMHIPSAPRLVTSASSFAHSEAGEHRVTSLPRQGIGQETSASVPGTSFAVLLRALGHEVDLGEAALRSAVRAPCALAAPGALLELQVRMYRYSEAVDLSAKIVERVSGGLKTVLQGS